MNTEEAKKIAEAIVIGVAATYGKAQTVSELKQKCIEILTADTAAPVEKEYRAGEWVPQDLEFYYSLGNGGSVLKHVWPNRQSDLHRLSQGNVFPTEAIAEAAKKHAEFWRAFDTADEGGEAYVSEMLAKGRVFRFKWAGVYTRCGDWSCSGKTDRTGVTMTDILTKEERETVERLRQYVEMPLRGKKSGRLAKSYCDNLLTHTRSLLDILDNLTKCNPPKSAELGVMMLGVKKYSEDAVETLARKYYMIPSAVNEYTETDALKIGAWHDCVSALCALEEK